MNYQGSYRKLLGNAQAAMLAAIEIYNKPIFQYRDECTVILLLNAWELVLKSLLSKNKESIFYPKKKSQPYRTLSWQDALSKGKNYFPDTVSHIPIQRNLELLATYRDNVVHFYNARDFGVVLYSLAQASITNFRDLLRDAFDINLAEQMNWQLLPIGIQPPVDLISYITSESSATPTTAVQQFLSELSRAIGDIEEANENANRLLTIFSIKLESIKKIEKADVVAAVEKETTPSGPLVITRTQDPNTSHPLRQKDILGKIDTLHNQRFTSYTFQAIVWKHKIKEKPQYCWQASTGGLILYSNDLITLIQNLTANDMQAALADYREFQRLKRSQSK